MQFWKVWEEDNDSLLSKNLKRVNSELTSRFLDW